MLSDIFYDKLAPETRQQLRKLDWYALYIVLF